MELRIPSEPFVVKTSADGGLSMDDVAELCVNKLIHVSDSAPPEIGAQARAYREYMLRVVRHYIMVAVREDRTTLAMELERAGMRELASQLKGR